LSRTAFTGAGATAGATPLVISYSCSNVTGVNAMALDMEWSFTAPAQTQASYSVIANTGGTATGVGVQIIDPSGNAIISGVPVEEILSVATGLNSLRYIVRYYQTSSTVTTGTVSATAQFTATYQ
jgi:major type 1 subunit fimbrin (pilin)